MIEARPCAGLFCGLLSLSESSGLVRSPRVFVAKASANRNGLRIEPGLDSAGHPQPQRLFSERGDQAGMRRPIGEKALWLRVAS